MITEDLRLELESKDLKELAQEIVHIKSLIKESENQVKELKAYEKYITEILVPERMDEEGIKNAQYDGIGRLQKSNQVQCNVKADDKESFLSFLYENGYGDMISENVHPSTLKSWVKDLIENDIQVPEQVNVHMYQKATVVKT